MGERKRARSIMGADIVETSNLTVLSHTKIGLEAVQIWSGLRIRCRTWGTSLMGDRQTDKRQKNAQRKQESERTSNDPLASAVPPLLQR